MSQKIERTSPDGWVCPKCGAGVVCTDTPGQYECEREICDGERALVATEHAEGRWNMRTHEYTYSVREGFERGVPLDPTHNLVGDEIRYDHPSRTATIRKDTGITTSIDMGQPWTHRKNVHAAIRTCVTELRDPEAAGELCAETNVDVETFREITSDLRDLSGKHSGQTATQNAYSDRRADGEGA